MCVCTCRGHRSASGVVSQELLFFESGSLTASLLELLGILLSLLSTAGTTSVGHHAGFLCGYVKIGLRSSNLQGVLDSFDC